MTDMEYDDDDDDFYEDDFTDEEDDEDDGGRGSSKGLNVSKSVPTAPAMSKPPAKRGRPAFTSRRNSRASVRGSRDEKRITKRNEERVHSSKRRQNLSLRNHLAEMTINYEEVVKENKILKQIQRRQERELDRYTNADEDLPRLLDANSHEIAGLKAKNKQLLFDKRDLDDKLRRQHQEIMTLKDQNKKLTTLSNNKKLGAREKLELDLTTAKVTIAHQDAKIQDLTKAVEIYKKTAEREVKSNQIQTRKAQNSLRELQDAYNDLFIKFKAREKELGNQNIYTQQARGISKRPMRSGPSQTSLSESKSTSRLSAVAEPSPRNTRRANNGEICRPRPSDSTRDEKQLARRQSDQLTRLESELEELNKQSTSLADLERALAEDHNSISSDDDVDREPVLEQSPRRKSSPPRSRNPSKETPRSIVPPDNIPVKNSSPPKPSDDMERIRREEAERLEREVETMRRREEEAAREEEERRRREEEERRRREEEEWRREEEMRRKEEERKQREEEEERRRVAEQDARRRAAEEEEARKKAALEEEERRLLEEKKKKDDALKEKLAAVRNQAGGTDFMSQLKAKRNTPSISPVTSTTPATTELPNRTTISNESARRTAANQNSRPALDSLDDDDLDTGYQPSFVPQNSNKVSPASGRSGASSKISNAGKIDPFGVTLAKSTSEYTPTFSTNQRISRDIPFKDKGWAPTGRASISQRNGLFESTLDHKPLKRRQSKPKNTLANNYANDFEDDLEELIL